MKRLHLLGMLLIVFPGFPFLLNAVLPSAINKIPQRVEKLLSSLPSKEIVDILLEKKRKELLGEGGLFEPDFLKRHRALYESYEGKFNEWKLKFPSYPVAGDLKYTMTLAEITKVIEKKFREMRKKGQIVTREEFKKLDKREWFFKPGSNLTRIWGAEYLAGCFKREKKSSYKVPSYIIVVDDLANLKILVCWSSCFPIISRVNGDIYAQRILGCPALPDVGFGFSDYTGPNILKNDDGLFYVIDTEYRSFYKAAPEKELYKNLKEDWPSLCEYLKNRFLLTNKLQGTCRSFRVSVI